MDGEARAMSGTQVDDAMAGHSHPYEHGICSSVNIRWWDCLLMQERLNDLAYRIFNSR